MRSSRSLAAAVLAALALAAAPSAAQQPSPLQVVVVTDEADAALAIARKAASGAVPDSADWARLTTSEGYVRLKEREAGMGRAFTDASFRAFVLSPGLRARVPALERALQGWRALDARSAAARALAYLPRGTVLRARVYPEVKPRTNSFVWGLPERPAIFFYLDETIEPAKAENTMAHELHHVGSSEGCPPAPDPKTGPERAAQLAGTFGEGVAVLAAAGGPTVHPHASSPASERAVWDRDVARWRSDFGDLQAFFLDVAKGRSGSDEETRRRWFTFVNTDSVPQGPFYTVGWVMASTVERELGRPAVIAAVCDPPELLRAWNRAAARIDARHPAEPLPLWSDELLALLPPERGPAERRP